MILLEDILELHSKSLNDFGGSHGIRELNMLESAISRDHFKHLMEMNYIQLFLKK